MKNLMLKMLLVGSAVYATACSKDERKEAEIPPVETAQSLLSIRQGTGKGCPPISGVYSCVDENTQNVRKVEYIQSADDKGRPTFSQKGEIPTDRKLVTRAFEFYVMNVEGGIITDGSIQDKSIPAIGVNLKYSVSCSDKILSLQAIAGDTAVRTTVERADNGNLKVDNWQTADGNGKVEMGRSQCQKVQ